MCLLLGTFFVFSLPKTWSWYWALCTEVKKNRRNFEHLAGWLSGYQTSSITVEKSSDGSGTFLWRSSKLITSSESVILGIILARRLSRDCCRTSGCISFWFFWHCLLARQFNLNRLFLPTSFPSLSLSVVILSWQLQHMSSGKLSLNPFVNCCLHPKCLLQP